MKNMILLGVLCIPVWCQAAIITVDRSDDLITAGDGGCDLREAINSANLNFAFEDCVAGEADTLDIVLIDVNQPIQLQFELGVIGSVLVSRMGAGPAIEILAGNDERHFNLTLTDSSDDDFAMVGLHLKNGNPGDNGGAILVNDAGRIEITDSIFENNTGHHGGAIYAMSSVVAEFKLLRNQFINNHGIDPNGSSTGGVLFGQNITAGELEIKNNLFRDNQADFGGAIFLNEGSDQINITKNRFYNNQAHNSGGALMLRALSTGQTYELDSNVLLNNQAAEIGGALYALGQGGLRVNIINSTLGMNQADQGGALASNGGNVQVIGSTLAHNIAATEGAQAYQTVGGIIAFSKSILAYAQSSDNCHGNIGSHLDNIEDDGSCGFGAAEGNLVADPQLSGLRDFQNPNPKVPVLLPGFELSVNSPAMDYEDNFLCWIPPGLDLNIDQNGQSRDVDGDGDGNATCDLGALESAADNDLIFQDSLGVF